MKKYFVVYASYLETEGLDASFQIYDTKEDAQKAMQTEYDMLPDMFNQSSYQYTFDCNELSADSYSISCESYYGYEKFEAYISEKEI